MEHWGELLADFQQYYGLDLRKCLDDGDYERAYLLTVNLPGGSRTLRAIDPRTAWGEQAYLLAAVVDNLTFLRYEQAGGKGKKPKPIQRPQAKPQKRRHRHLKISAERREALLFGKRK